MDYILISFQSGDKEMIDLRVPLFTTVEELLSIFHEVLGTPNHHEAMLQAEPLGRILNNNRTLEQEGVTQGSLLTLV